ncbi:MAG: hypothetical protein HSCHL_2324 [Hydrogenibacillus schlegelii]|uniref:Uncharacterized protein n=1 Tax=Hydrogenibacillus schlegelii TaxID=1484 RepID=A0A2T5GEX6_HYDSH|nr:MAG: hypothetical protein HSCHL_2324 [Hydrogenibacillus schlegelii]
MKRRPFREDGRPFVKGIVAFRAGSGASTSNQARRESPSRFAFASRYRTRGVRFRTTASQK